MLCFDDQHEALLPLRINCWPQRGLESSRKECKVKNALKSIALVVKGGWEVQVTSGMASCPVSNIGAAQRGF